VKPALALWLGGLAGGALYLLGWLTPGGAVAAGLLGALALLWGGPEETALLVAFVAASNLLGRPTRRRASQVLANGLPAVLALLCCQAGFLGALGAAAADTLASEVGTKAPSAWRPDLGRVPAGTNAAMSLRGTIALLAAAAAVAAVAPLFGASPVAVFAGASAGAMADTAIGLLLEERLKFWGNDLTNLAATSIGALVAALLG